MEPDAKAEWSIRFRTGAFGPPETNYPPADPLAETQVIDISGIEILAAPPVSNPASLPASPRSLPLPSSFPVCLENFEVGHWNKSEGNRGSLPDSI